MRRVIRPILGVGIWGWSLAPVALALAWGAAGGFDARTALLRLVNAAAGPAPMFSVVTSGLPAYHFACLSAVPGPITLCFVLLAMHLSPRPWPRWSWWALVAILLPFPLVWWHVFARGLARLSRHLSGINSQFAAAVIGVLLLAGVCWLVTRRRGVVLWAAGATALAAGAEWLIAMGPPPERMPGWVPQFAVDAWPAVATYFVPVAWNAALAGLLVGWAMGERRRARREVDVCAHCGYDMRGLTQGRGLCPECGAGASGAG